MSGVIPMQSSLRGTLWTLAGWVGVVSGVVGVLYSSLMLLFVIGSAIDSAASVIRYPTSALLPLLLPAIVLGPSLLAFFAGLGLIRRRSYGRVCTLAFGALAVVTAALSLWNLWTTLVRHVWEHFHHTELPNGPSLGSQFVEALGETPAVIAFVVIVALLCRSVYLHPEMFRAPREGGNRRDS